ncbi:RNase adapter RapZ [Aquicoccus sp. SCR17]|nr:RNase adapter RapZ [Carideicomes alvinocaridis]
MKDTSEEMVASERLVLVTGPSGAGRSTAINALEDLGYEAIDNLPMSLMPRLLEGPPLSRPLALGIDARNREFSTLGFLEMLARLRDGAGPQPELLFLDCSEAALLRRFSETRRRHPLSPQEAPGVGIAREIELLAPIRQRADVLLDTSELSPHDLRAEIEGWFGGDGGQRLAVSVQSFSYKRGVPRGIDMMIDCRFLRNPHWDPELRPQTGRDPAVAEHVRADPTYAEFFERTRDLLLLLLPAYTREGKSHFSIGFGCTGGRHRSVAVAESTVEALAQQGWRVSIRHRELERVHGHGDEPPPSERVTDGVSGA